jgi:exoribonuclease R
MYKRIAAVALKNRIGQIFAAAVTGVTGKGVFVRISDPPAEGLLARGQQGLDVGDRLQVKLLSAEPQRGYLDFGE